MQRSLEKMTNIAIINSFVPLQDDARHAWSRSFLSYGNIGRCAYGGRERFCSQREWWDLNFCSIRSEIQWMILYVRTRVLPESAPATTMAGPSQYRTISRWLSFNSSNMEWFTFVAFAIRYAKIDHFRQKTWSPRQEHRITRTFYGLRLSFHFVPLHCSLQTWR